MTLEAELADWSEEPRLGPMDVQGLLGLVHFAFRHCEGDMDAVDGREGKYGNGVERSGV